MPRGLRPLLLGTDLGMLLYWSVAVFAAAGLLTLPAGAMYAGYGQPVMTAWNWSFAPLDLAFSVVGLLAVRRRKRGADWRPLAIVSLTLTIAAGGMAVGFWALIGFFDPAWWLPNLFLLLWPLPYLAGLLR